MTFVMGDGLVDGPVSRPQRPRFREAVRFPRHDKLQLHGSGRHGASPHRVVVRRRIAEWNPWAPDVRQGTASPASPAVPTHPHPPMALEKLEIMDPFKPLEI